MIIKNKTKYLIFLIVITLTLLIPFAAMPFAPTSEATEFAQLADPPMLWVEGEWNYNFMYDAGTYFEDHFAFRPYFLTANAMIRGNILGASGTQQVIVGRGGWLYFSETLNDFLGEELLSERELYAVVHNLGLMQEYVQRWGSHFTVMIVPNKNSLYPEHMPFYYWPGEVDNWTNLRPLLIEHGISFVDMFEVLEASEERTYFLRDTHWTNYGAMLGNRAMIEFMGREAIDYTNVPYEVRRNHVGDLDEMLRPAAYILEDNIYFLDIMTYQHVTEVVDYMDHWIQTFNPHRTGSVLMYRDSFGEYLLPFTANEFETGFFSRYVPYNLSEVGFLRPDYVVLQRVERNIFEFANQAPIMEPVEVSPVEPTSWIVVEEGSSLGLIDHGGWIEIRGLVDEALIQVGSDIYISLRGEATGHRQIPTFYRLTPDGVGNGFQVFIRGDLLPEEDRLMVVDVLVRNDSEVFHVASYDWER